MTPVAQSESTKFYHWLGVVYYTSSGARLSADEVELLLANDALQQLVAEAWGIDAFDELTRRRPEPAPTSDQQEVPSDMQGVVGEINASLDRIMAGQDRTEIAFLNACENVRRLREELEKERARADEAEAEVARLLVAMEKNRDEHYRREEKALAEGAGDRTRADKAEARVAELEAASAPAP